MNSAKKNADKEACSHTEHDCSTFFSAGISQAKNGELLICCLFHALEIYLYSLSFHLTTFTLLLSYENRTNCSYHRILITELIFCNKVQALSWADRYPVA